MTVAEDVGFDPKGVSHHPLDRKAAPVHVGADGIDLYTATTL